MTSSQPEFIISVGKPRDQQQSSGEEAEKGPKEASPYTNSSATSVESTASTESQSFIKTKNSGVERHAASEKKDEQVLAAKQDFETTLSQLSFLSAQTPSKAHPDLNKGTSLATVGNVKYQYAALDPGKREIRLLLVLPAVHWDDPIMCDLATFPLGENMRVPYDALSYCWGGSQDTVPIDIHGGIYQVTANLATFLRTRRHGLSHTTKKPGVVWIDALCINQDDTREREQQIMLMRSIYQHAASLLIWLGEETGDSNLAMDLLRRLGCPGEETSKVWIMENHEILALENMFQRSWWKRTWIVQELVNGGGMNDTKFWSRMVMCGFTVLPWYYVANAAKRLYRHNDDNRQYFKYLELILGLEAAKQSGTSMTSPKILHLLDRHRGREATDPRDKVFGLLGMADSKDAVYRRVNVDYGQSTAQLYMSITLSAIADSDSLDILRSCHQSNIQGLPSWAVDWSTPCGYKQLKTKWTIATANNQNYEVAEQDGAPNCEELSASATTQDYNASKSSSPQIEFLESEGSLKVKGIFFDTINFIGDTFPENVTEPWENSAYFMLLVARCKSIALPFPSDNPYTTTEAQIAAFWNTLFADHTGDGNYPASKYVSLPHYSAPPADSANQYAKLHNWLPPIPKEWVPGPPRITETSKGRLHAGAWGALVSQVFNRAESSTADGTQFKTTGPGVGMRMDYLPNTWTAAQLEQHTREFHQLAKLWENGPFDLLNSPFSLPNVVPDPYYHCRSTGPVATIAQSCDGLHGIHEYALGRRFFITEKGYFGLGPPEAETGDSVVVLLGGDVPFVLRKTRDETNNFTMVGEAHAQGIMDGELMQSKVETKTFCLA